MITLDKLSDLGYNLVSLDDLENMMAMSDDDIINELAGMLASIGMNDEIDEDEAVLDMLYAEHEERMRAANSYDEDAISYGEMV
jgi:hypothetical protein